MSNETTNVVATETVATSKSKARQGRKLAKKNKSKSVIKSQHSHTTREGARVAIDVRTNKALKFIKEGAFGGRGARTSAIENAIKSSKRPLSVRQIEEITHAKAVAMHVRTLYTGARGRKYIGRKIDETTGAQVYFALKAPITVKLVTSKSK